MRKYKLWNTVSHASIILSVVFLVFFVIDRFNPAMSFIGCDLSDWLLMIFCVFALTNGILSAAHLFRRAQIHRVRKPEGKQT